MTLGTGIFLAAIVMSLTALFIATKDRWNWKKILLWPLGICVAGGLAMWGYIEYDNRADEARAIEKKGPTVQSSFWDIPLGATQDDVFFKKGKPNGGLPPGFELDSETSAPTSLTNKKLSPAKKQFSKDITPGAPRGGDEQVTSEKEPVVDEPLWKSAPLVVDWDWLLTYTAGAEKYAVFFTANRVSMIIQYGDSAYPEIAGVSLASSTAAVTSTFGEPEYVSSSDEGAERTYCYPAYQVLFYLRKDRVTSLGIYDRTSPPPVCAPPAKDDAIKK